MPTIAPFDLNPDQSGLDRFTGFWYASIMRASYDPPSATKLALWALAGVTSMQRVEIPGQPIPKSDVGIFPAGRAVVAVSGTTARQEYAIQAAGAVLVPIPPWPGAVGFYWSALALGIWDRVRPILQANGVAEVALCGHSQGGAVAQLLAELVGQQPGMTVACVCTMAATRAGNATYAAGQPWRHMRLTNAGDPVPMLPPSESTPLDRFLWLLPPPPLTSWRHWGTRFHLFEDGSATAPPELPTWVEGSQYLVSQIAAASWFAAHDTTEYGRRLRVGIPAQISAANPDYPGLKQLDEFWESQTITPPAVDWMDPALCP